MQLEHSYNKLFTYKYIICVLLLFTLTSGISYYNHEIFPTYDKKPFYFEQDGYLNEAGSVLRYAIPVGALAITLALRDFSGAVQLLNSYSVTFTIAYTIKKFIHEERPLHQNNNSFPSGHTANAFAGSWFLLRRYGINTVFVISSLLALLTAFSRVATGWHHIQDVLTSLILASIVAFFLVKPYIKKINKNNKL